MRTLSTAYDGLVDVARRGGSRGHADRPRPRDVAAGDHGRRDDICIPAPPRASAIRTGRSSRPATSCARSSDPSAGARGPPRISRRLSGPMHASGDRAVATSARASARTTRPARSSSTCGDPIATSWEVWPGGRRSLPARRTAIWVRVPCRRRARTRSRATCRSGYSRWFAIPTFACGRGSPARTASPTRS